jgi:methionine-rich copper-binding protein CopC
MRVSGAYAVYTMRSLVAGLLMASAGVWSGAHATARVADSSLPHITMERSEPADGSKVSSVTEIRLFFTGAPLMRGASVRVATSSRQLMRSTPPAPDAKDPKQVFVNLDPPLAPGTYVVQWRCIADDGHVMRGQLTFEVTAE